MDQKESPKRLAKNIIFLIHTEYHLLLSFAYYSYYKKDYKPTWLILVQPNSNRFNLRQIVLSELPGEVIHEIYDWELPVFSINKKTLNIIENIAWDEIVMATPSYLISGLFIKKTISQNPCHSKLTIISDGFAFGLKMPIWWILKQHMILYYRKSVNGINHLPNLLYTFKSAFKYATTIIAQYPVQGNIIYINSSDLIKRFIQENKDQLNKIFQLSEAKPKANAIFFTQPVESKYQNDYIKTINLLCNEFFERGKYLLIKVHPAEQIEKYLKFANDYVQIYANTTIPAELFFTYYKETALLTCYSSVLLNSNENQKNIWLYKLINYQISGIIENNNNVIVNDLNELKLLISSKEI